MGSVLFPCKDHLRIAAAVIISTEVLPVILCQLVLSAVDNLVAVSLAVAPPVGTSVDFRIQVQPCQKHPGSSLICLWIRGSGGAESVFNGKQFRLNIV